MFIRIGVRPSSPKVKGFPLEESLSWNPAAETDTCSTHAMWARSQLKCQLPDLAHLVHPGPLAGKILAKHVSERREGPRVRDQAQSRAGDVA